MKFLDGRWLGTFLLLSSLLFCSRVTYAQEAVSYQVPTSQSLPLGESIENLPFESAAEPPLVLEDVLDEARERNPEIAAARRKWEVEKALIWAVKSWPDPEVGVEFWGRNEKWYDVSQTIPFPGKLALKGKAQAHEAEREFELYQAKEKEILQKVKAAYYAYFLVRRQIEIFESSVDLLKNFARVAESKYSVNEVTQSDVLKAQVEYSKSLNALVTLKQEKESAQAELNALLDRRPHDALGKPAEPDLPPLELDYEGLERVALESRPELHAARHHVDHMKAELRSTKADFLPDTTVQYTRRVFDDMKDDNVVMVKWNVPILWFWRQGSEVKAARKAKEVAEEELRLAETTTRLDVKTMLVKVQTARRLVELYKTSVIPQAEAALHAATKGYESGRVGFLDLIDSERSWLEFQMEYYGHLAQYWSYLAALERVLGRDLLPTEPAQEELS